MARIFVEPNPLELVVAPSEVPQDVNPQDPDDEVFYFSYDNWRDMEDSEMSEDEFITAMEEYDEHFFQDSQEIL